MLSSQGTGRQHGHPPAWSSESLGCSQSWGGREARGGVQGWPTAGRVLEDLQYSWGGSQGPLGAGAGSWRQSPRRGGDDPPLAGNVERLSKTYPKISEAQNAELRLRWCQIVLKNNLEAEYSKVKAFLHSQVRPWAAAASGRDGHRTFCARGQGLGSCS